MTAEWIRFFNYIQANPMSATESLEEFYQRKFEWLPEDLDKNIGHFNLFKLEPPKEGQPTTVPYRRRDFYKVMLVKGHSRVHYADKVYEVKKQALSFSNPLIPYKWEHLDGIRDGVYCVFNTEFFHQMPNFGQYEVFQSNSNHIFELNDDQADQVSGIFGKMEAEFNSGYKYKFDIVRNNIQELIHFALKLEPGLSLESSEPMNASRRISMLFMELLERQFPIDDQHPSIQLKSPAEFADSLNVHVNSLNRAVKTTTSKTTSEIIAERIVQESKVLLKQTAWNVSEIAYALGFKEVTHFNNFFKKHLELSPLKFRNA